MTDREDYIDLTKRRLDAWARRIDELAAEGDGSERRALLADLQRQVRDAVVELQKLDAASAEDFESLREAMARRVDELERDVDAAGAGGGDSG